MIVAHVGPPAARQGGPAGYLAQLQSALDTYGTGHHEVRLPARRFIGRGTGCGGA